MDELDDPILDGFVVPPPLELELDVLGGGDFFPRAPAQDAPNLDWVRHQLGVYQRRHADQE
jgi:hypothetical protein